MPPPPPPAATVAATVRNDALAARDLERSRNLAQSNQLMRERLDNALELVSGVAQGTVKLASATSAARDTAAAISEAIDGLRVTSLTISDQVHRSQKIADGVNGHVTRAKDGVRGLGESVNEIGAIVGIIAGLARQTNLLALNAAIEAARAGEAGRGFSIVASEVKSLSVATQKATEQISSVIERVRGSAYRSIDDVGALGGAITELQSAFETVAEALEVQTGSASEIAASSIEAARVAQLVDEERTIVEETSRKCLEVMSEAGRAARDAHDLIVGLETSFATNWADDGFGISPREKLCFADAKRSKLMGRLVLPSGLVDATVSRSARGELQVHTTGTLTRHLGRTGVLHVDGVGVLPARVTGAEASTAMIVLEAIDPQMRNAIDRVLG